MSSFQGCANGSFFPIQRFPLPHDPSGGSDLHTIEITLDDGDSLLNTSTLTIVDANDQPLTENAPPGYQALELIDVQFGQVTGATGNVWGASFYPRFGVPRMPYRLRLRPFYALGLDGVPGEDITILLDCRDQ